ncbi:MAG TPA: anti-sigma factor [Polyangiaceae bacterium]|jgi:hypothetical protein|nr:anti-sigma factor [Polyangiaceae bacterium]
MDCEKFESALMDELYGELDELTSAAMRRHVEGCARCASLMSGLRATRRVASLPRLELPVGLEQRILAATAAARPKVAPLRGRLARAVSLAGGWAMRPQTAMAAVFLVMIGSSVLLLRGKSSRSAATSPIYVTEEGSPAPAPPPAAAQAPPNDIAASASPAAVAAAPVPAATSLALSPAFATKPASASPRPAPQPRPGLEGDDSRAADGRLRAPAKTASGAGVAKGGGMDDSLGPNAYAHAAPRRAAPDSEFAPPPPPAAPMMGGAAAGAASPAPVAAAPAAEADKTEKAEPAPPSDPGDELWAARAARDAAARQGRACPSGPRFDDVASRSPGTPIGWDALYEGGLCYESAGDYGSARTRLGTLLGVPSHAYRARISIDRINKEQSGGSAAASRAAPKAAAPASPPATSSPPPAAGPPAASPPATGSNR